MKLLVPILFIFSIATLHPYTLYLDLMKKCILNTIYQDPSYWGPFDLEKREAGRDWPTQAHTMIGLAGLNNIQFCLEDIITNNVQGDCIETGVWRGGAVIFMRAILKEHNITNKTIWVADSFEGLPAHSAVTHSADIPINVEGANKVLAVSLDTVRENFLKYGLLDQQVQFLKGWFKNTLPSAPITQLCLLRLDGDFYESTMDVLINLYPKLAPGGYIIIDDYVAHVSCAQAINDYRAKHRITEPIQRIGWSIAYWKKTI